jgi:hypothetical protein
MLDFHNEDMTEEMVVDCIMSVPATALLTVARRKGYDISVDSEFIPMELVEASS